MNSHIIELNDKKIEFRLTSGNCLKIEKEQKMSILEYIKQINMTAITNLLMYMRRPFDNGFDSIKACDLYDELINSGYTMEKIVYDVIYETLVVSGFFTKEQLKETKEEVKEIQLARKEQAKKEILAN